MKRYLLLLILAAPAIGFAPQQPLDGIAQFVDPLPELPHLRAPWPGPFRLTIPLRAFQAKLHRDLPAVTQWGYDGTSPGPIIDVERGQWLGVEWKNELPTTHLFPLPKGADVISPDVRSVTHLHGAEVREPNPMDREHNNDGWPDAWNVPGQSQFAEYPNNQSARMLWYHDHAMGSTGRNVAAGLLGLYEIHDDYERSLGLPEGRFEIPLAIQAHTVNPDGSLAYTDDISNEYYGNSIAVNGKLWPYLEVEPRKYRFRVINVSNARTYALKLFDQADNSSGPAFYQIGSDSGFLGQTAILNDPTNVASPRLTLGPAERADVIIDFSKSGGHNLILENNSRDIGDNELALPQVMLFKVGTALSQPDLSRLPMQMKPIARIPVTQAKVTRQIVFNQMNMPGGETMQTLNNKRWNDPIEEKPELGATEIWELVDTLTDVHPFHIHLVQFQVLDRRLFDVVGFLNTGTLTYTGDPVPPADNEMGWKDTVRVLPQMVTRIIMRFLPYPGYYVYHCHILEHEDMDMMRPFQIVLPTAGNASVTER